MQFVEDRYRQARVWLGESPPALEPVAMVWHRRTLEAREQEGALARSIALEIREYVGGRYRYGLLGAEFYPKPGAVLTVEVGVASPTGPVWADSLMSRYDVVRAGLLPEYAEAVLDGAVPGKLGPGVLHFGVAACGEVSSSAAAFRRLSRAVVSLLVQQSESLSPGRLAEILWA